MAKKWVRRRSILRSRSRACQAVKVSASLDHGERATVLVGRKEETMVVNVPVVNIRPLVEILEYFSSKVCHSFVILRCWSKTIGVIPRPLWGPFLALALFLSEIESTIIQRIICEHKLAIPTRFQPPLSTSTQRQQTNASQGQNNAFLTVELTRSAYALASPLLGLRTQPARTYLYLSSQAHLSSE